MSKTAPTENISADDLRNKLQSFQNGLQGKVDDKKSTLVHIAIFKRANMHPELNIHTSEYPLTNQYS